MHIIKQKVLVLAFIFPLIIYWKTLMPFVDFWDTGEFQTVPYTFDVPHPTGYPTYLILGKLVTTFFRIGSVAYTMNFLSALLVSLGIFLISLSLYKLTKNLMLSLFSSFLLSLNTFVWSIAQRADPHALHLFFATLFIYLAIKIIDQKNYNQIVYLSFITGLSLGNHLLAIFFIPALIGLYFVTLGRKIFSFKIVLPVVALIIGASVYAVLPIISHYKEPLTISYRVDNWAGFKHLVLGQDFQGEMLHWSKGNFSDTWNFYSNITSAAFPIFLWIFIPIGIVVGFWLWPMVNAILLIIFSGTLYFAMTYQNAVIERYYLVPLAISVFWISFAFHFFIKKFGNKIVNVEVCIILVLSTLFLLQKNYKEIDQSHNTGALSWVTETFNSIDRDGVVFSWWSYSTPMWYMQRVENKREDIKIINTSQGDWESAALNYLNTRPVYFVNKIDLTNKNLELLPVNNIYKLVSTNR